MTLIVIRKLSNMFAFADLTLGICHVLHIFEEKYPDDKRPRKAIKTASNWIKRHINEVLSDTSRFAKDPSENIRIDDDAIDAYTYYNDAAAYSYYISHIAVDYDVDYIASYTAMAAYYAAKSSSNESLEIKWQRY